MDIVFSCPAGQLERWSFLNGIKPIVEVITSSIFAVKNITAAPVLESVAKALEEGACETFEEAKLFSTEKRTSFDSNHFS